MINHRFPFALLFVAALLMSQSFSAMAQSTATYDDITGKKDKPPRPKPPIGPRDGGGGDE